MKLAVNLQFWEAAACWGVAASAKSDPQGPQAKVLFESLE